MAQQKFREPFLMGTIRDVMVENGLDFNLNMAHEIYDELSMRKIWKIKDIEDLIIEKRKK
jgi:hypothetical protein